MALSEHFDTASVWRLIPALVAAAAVGFLVGRRSANKVNRSVDKANPKVVHLVDVEDIADKKSYCRCWRSQKFPLCDGSHNKHNELTGDNVGPLVIKHKN